MYHRTSNRGNFPLISFNFLVEERIGDADGIKGGLVPASKIITLKNQADLDCNSLIDIDVSVSGISTKWQNRPAVGDCVYGNISCFGYSQGWLVQQYTGINQNGTAFGIWMRWLYAGNKWSAWKKQ